MHASSQVDIKEIIQLNVLSKTKYNKKHFSSCICNKFQVDVLLINNKQNKIKNQHKNHTTNFL